MACHLSLVLPMVLAAGCPEFPESLLRADGWFLPPDRAVERTMDCRPADGRGAELAPADVDPGEGSDFGGSCSHVPVAKQCVGKVCIVPPGCFIMGSTPGEPCRLADESSHPVRLTHAFRISLGETTAGVFLQHMGYLPVPVKPPCTNLCPVVSSTWHEAAAFCNKLSQANGLLPCYKCSGSQSTVACLPAPAFSGSKKIHDCPGFRLPTEAEWEYAARAGTKSAYYNGAASGTCGGADPKADLIGWYKLNSGGGLHPGLQKVPNGWGLFDMSGNALEWVHDLYVADLGTGLATNPEGSAGGPQRVARGGSFAAPSGALRSAARFKLDPGQPTGPVGFRCIQTIHP